MTIRILVGDCRDHMAAMEPNSVDSIVCDPPYGLEFMGKEWDRLGRKHALRGETSGLPTGPGSGRGTSPTAGRPGFDLSHDAQHAMQTWHESWAREAYRVLKPGGYLLAFGGTRTSHRLVCAIEDAGFEIRDTLCWMYGSGFPKSHNISKAIDKHGGANIAWFGPWLREERERRGITQKELAQHFPSKTGGLTGCVANWELSLNLPTVEQFNKLCDVLDLPFTRIEEAEREVLETRTYSRSDEGSWAAQVRSGMFQDGERTHDITAPATELARQWDGWGSALKPSYEPIVVARKPLIGTLAANVTQYGTGGLNIDGCRIGTTRNTPASLSSNKFPNGFGPMRSGAATERDLDPNIGRWPPNCILDETAAAALDAMSGECSSKRGPSGEIRNNAKSKDDAWFGTDEKSYSTRGYPGDTGGASRFMKVVQPDPLPIESGDELRFRYTAKAGRAERNKGLEGMPDFDGKAVESAHSTVCAKCGRQRVNVSGQCQCPEPEWIRVQQRSSANHHPTVKPLDLMQWLCRLVTPPGGTVLDPFMGSGSTLVAADREGFHGIGIEMDSEYAEIARRRIMGDCPMFADVAAD